MTTASLPLLIYLIRHGETEWSPTGQYTGRTDIPLTAHGEDAARQLGLRLRDILFTHVLTSPLQRAQQTCALAGLSLVAGWIGLSVEKAQHLLLNTASLSILCYEHNRADLPAIELWNSAASQTYHPGHATTHRERRPGGKNAR